MQGMSVYKVKQFIVHIFVAVIVPELALFDMQVKCIFIDSSEFHQAVTRKTTEAGIIISIGIGMGACRQHIAPV
jgi:hypothetical protein